MIEKNDNDYMELLRNLKTKIIETRQRAIISVNKELILMYWEIGKMIIDKQSELGWGSKVIENLSKDLKKMFPEIKGFSLRNLKYMKKLASEYSDNIIVQQVVAQISWSHNIILMDKIKDYNKRIWYIKKTIENGWSRNVLLNQLDIKLIERQAENSKTSNFKNTLPEPQSELAIQTLKDPYIFDFLTIADDAKERDIEKQLIKHITKFLLELGSGFAFVGNQYHIEVAGEDYYLDLLFYHIKLKCFVVIELKTGKFKPEFAGKVNFYLSAIDEELKSETDNPSIGIILCKDRNKLIAEYSLRDMTKPIGVTEYKILERIPEELKSSLPTVEELELELKHTLNE